MSATEQAPGFDRERIHWFKQVLAGLLPKSERCVFHPGNGCVCAPRAEVASAFEALLAETYLCKEHQDEEKSCRGCWHRMFDDVSEEHLYQKGKRHEAEAKVAVLLEGLRDLVKWAESYMGYHSEKFYDGATVKPTGLWPAINKAKKIIEGVKQ